ncbi:hypothetical protein [Sulfurimonas sp. NWX79]|uniref:hypothetical protein n=1 Tax=Sulfurimonas sp. NWX79 TaxID=2925412 RepID=UPI003204D97F
MEEKLDLILKNQKFINEKIDLFLPDISTEKGVIHFLNITKNTYNAYLNNGVLIEGIHYIVEGEKRVFNSEAVIKLKKGGVKGKHRTRATSNNQNKIDAINRQLGIIPCADAS